MIIPKTHYPRHRDIHSTLCGRDAKVYWTSSDSRLITCKTCQTMQQRYQRTRWEVRRLRGKL